MGLRGAFALVTSFRGPGGDPCSVDDRTILTFSQSENPASPHYADQTRMFSNKEWVDPAFCESEMAAEPGVVTEKLTQPQPAKAFRCKQKKAKESEKRKRLKVKRRCLTPRP